MEKQSFIQQMLVLGGQLENAKNGAEICMIINDANLLYERQFMDKFTEYNSRMIVLRNEFARLCKIEDTTIEQRAQREVAEIMFDALTYGITDGKLNAIENLITDYRHSKENN